MSIASFPLLNDGRMKNPREGSKKPNLYFGILKRVKNGPKWLKNCQKKYVKILYFS